MQQIWRWTDIFSNRTSRFYNRRRANEVEPARQTPANYEHPWPNQCVWTNACAGLFSADNNELGWYIYVCLIHSVAFWFNWNDSVGFPLCEHVIRDIFEGILWYAYDDRHLDWWEWRCMLNNRTFFLRVLSSGAVLDMYGHSKTFGGYQKLMKKLLCAERDWMI